MSQNGGVSMRANTRPLRTSFKAWPRASGDSIFGGMLKVSLVVNPPAVSIPHFRYIPIFIFSRTLPSSPVPY